jgi:hypothetical protein
MKTSNKILLGIFLSILLLTTTIQLMVFAKYKRGDYTAFRRDEFYPLTKFVLPPVRFVSISGLGNCVIENSDSTKLEVQDYKDGQVVYRVKDDTLFINVDKIEKKSNAEDAPLTYKLVKVYVPAAVPVKATSSRISITGTPDPVRAASFIIHLERNCDFGVHNKNQEDADMYFKRLTITSDMSYMQLDDHIIVDSLQIDPMVASTLDDKNALIKSIMINADDKSKVNLSGKNIKSLK